MDGAGPGIPIAPIGALLGLGVMAYGAKSLIDVMKDKSLRTPKAVQSRQHSAPRTVQSRGFDIDASINKMLGR
jgi:hypothetical protein